MGQLCMRVGVRGVAMSSIEHMQACNTGGPGVLGSMLEGGRNVAVLIEACNHVMYASMHAWPPYGHTC